MLESGRRADHEVAEVRLDRRRLADQMPLRGADLRPRLLVDGLAVSVGDAHRARQRQPEPVAGHPPLPEAALDLLEHGRRRRPVAGADLAVVDDAAVTAGAGLHLALAGGVVPAKVRGLVDSLGRRPPSLVEEHGSRRHLRQAARTPSPAHVTLPRVVRAPARLRGRIAYRPLAARARAP